MAEEEEIGLDRVGSEEQATGGNGGEVVGLFQGRWSGVFATGSTVAHKETGDIAFDESLIEIYEQMTEVLVGGARLAWEQVDEGIEDDETGVHAFDSLEEGEKIFWEREGTVASRVKFRRGLLDERKEFDAGKVCAQGSEKLELSCGRVGIGSHDDHAALDGRSAVWHGSATGDGGGNLEREERFATVQVTVEERDTGEGETFLPEPANRLGFGFGGICLVNGKGDREFVDRGFVFFQQFFERGEVW
jgi:hypothetical protein